MAEVRSSSSLAAPLLDLVFAILASLSLTRVFCTVFVFEGTFFKIAAVDQPTRAETVAALALGGGGLWLFRRRFPAGTAARMLAPFALTFPLTFLPTGLWTVVAAIAALGWSAYRGVRCGLGGGLVRLCGRHRRFTVAVLIVLALLFMAQGIYASQLALRTLYLAGTDWMTYLEIPHNFFTAGRFHGEYPVPNFSAGHLMPGYIVLLAPFFGLFPGFTAAAIAAAGLLWGSSLLFYWLGRKLKMSVFAAAAGALVWMLYPSVANMNLCLFYGFNAIYAFIPVFLVYLYCHETGRHKSAFAIFLFSLTIKETLGMFWASWGVMLFLRGERRRGMLYSAIGAAYFLIAIKLLIPHGGDDYIFYAQYGHLGNGVWEILQSPFTRPAAFWGQLLGAKNLLFLALVLLPVLPAALNRPDLMGASSGILVFHLIRNSRDIVNITQHYQLELVLTLAAAMLLGCKAARGGDRLDRVLSVGLAGRRGGNGRVRYALAVASLAAVLPAHYFFAQSFFGVNRLAFLGDLPDMRPVIEEFKREIPAGAYLEAGENVAGHFVFRNRVKRLGDSGESADYRFYALGMPNATSERVHESVLADPAYTLRLSRQVGTHKLFLFRRNPQPATGAAPAIVWEDAGSPLAEVGDATDSFDVRGKVVEHDGRRFFRAVGRFNVPVARWVEIRVLLFAGGRLLTMSLLPRGGAALPADWRPGELFATELELPPGVEIADTAARLSGVNSPAMSLLPPDAEIR
ncbi:MAG: DUF2079 domain-containing protein [Victivallaceae bacterium]